MDVSRIGALQFGVNGKAPDSWKLLYCVEALDVVTNSMLRHI